MNCLMESFASVHVYTIELGGSPPDWHLEFAAALVANQQPEGCWLEDNWGDDILCTAWALLVHKRVVPPLLVDVKVVWPTAPAMARATPFPSRTAWNGSSWTAR